MTAILFFPSLTQCCDYFNGWMLQEY